eukprot:CAMPEP_0184303312 /NCGR_PEP_ID=MMETSP1049-20130417/13074_1 /TAXON_ID=77928 /ORGANISM="Proteomonas sulcata, Strain CCMP704" /LENGTH=42 /DNA_ID= /DNA_START= /DNA_END= /DNA_ORIENTATION=
MPHLSPDGAMQPSAPGIGVPGFGSQSLASNPDEIDLDDEDDV